MNSDFGLYIHIPFCANICHYCDFAKTARYDSSLVDTYFKRLQEHLKLWLERLQPRFSSVFLGGGTPSAFSHEYAPLFKLLAPYLQSRCEISLEANPDDLLPERLQIWRELGVNRLSIGMQTFNPQGLRFLTRLHETNASRRAIATAKAYFPNLNIDLIYGWQGQTLGAWREDLEIASKELVVPHLSLYNLTYEPRTVLGRRATRGALKPAGDDLLEEFYGTACDVLRTEGYDHEEVSNWSRPGFACAHNWLYWRGNYFLGIGAGAHSFLPIKNHSLGLRYEYDRSLKKFLDMPAAVALELFRKEASSPRQTEAWLSEHVGSTFRTVEGIDLAHIKRVSGASFVPDNILAEGLRRKLLNLNGDRLTMSESQWFVENSWCGHLLTSLKLPSGAQMQA